MLSWRLKGVVIFYVVVVLALCLVMAVNAVPERFSWVIFMHPEHPLTFLLQMVPKTLSIRDPGLNLPTETGRTSPPHLPKRRRNRLVSMDVLRRRPFDSQIGW